MKFWVSIASLFGQSKARSTAAHLRLSTAYRNVFLQSGSASNEDKQIVLADLQAKSMWARVVPPSTPDHELRHVEGMRTTYAVIHGHLSLSPADIEALSHAARLEAVVDSN